MNNLLAWFSSPKDDLSTDSKMVVGQFLSRKELTHACCTEPGWADYFATYPKQFKQRRVFRSLNIIWATARDLDDPEIAVAGQYQWTEAEQFKNCCRHLEAQANELVGQRFAAGLDAQGMIAIDVSPPAPSYLRYSFKNEIADAGVAFHVLHMLSHIREVVFEKSFILMNNVFPVPPFSGMNPVVAELLLPLHIRKLQLVYQSIGGNLMAHLVRMLRMPILSQISDDCKMEELVWMNYGEPMMPLELEMILDFYAINKSRGGDAYKQLSIYFREQVSADKCQEYIQTVIQFFAERAEGAKKFVPQVKLDFGALRVDWPLPFFKRRTPADKNRVQKRECFEGTFTFQETTEQGELNFQVTAHTYGHPCDTKLQGVTFDFVPDERH